MSTRKIEHKKRESSDSAHQGVQGEGQQSKQQERHSFELKKILLLSTTTCQV